MDGTELLLVSGAWGGCSDQSSVKSSSVSESKSGDTVIGRMPETLMNRVGVKVDFMEHFAKELN